MTTTKLLKKKKPKKKDSEYFAMLGRVGGQAILDERGPEWFAELGRRSHPRKVYSGGRPKGSKNKPKE